MIVKDLFVICKSIKEDIVGTLIEDRCSNWTNIYNTAMYRDPERFKDKSFEQVVRECLEEYTNNMITAYDDILKIEPVLHPDMICNVYPYQYVDDEYGFIATNDVSCVQKDEFLKEFKYYRVPPKKYDDLVHGDYHSIIPYDFFLEERKDILGYTVGAPTLIYDICTVMADLLFELTWFGYDNETYEKNLHKELEEFDESSKTGSDSWISAEDLDLDLEDEEPIEDETGVIGNSNVDISEMESDCALANFVIQNSYYNMLYDSLRDPRDYEKAHIEQVAREVGKVNKLNISMYDSVARRRNNKLWLLYILANEYVLASSQYDLMYKLYDDDSLATEVGDAEEALVQGFKDVGFNDATIGAIIAENGGAYGYTDVPHQEENEDEVRMFMPKSIAVIIAEINKGSGGDFIFKDDKDENESDMIPQEDVYVVTYMLKLIRNIDGRHDSNYKMLDKDIYILLHNTSNATIIKILDTNDHEKWSKDGFLKDDGSEIDEEVYALFTPEAVDKRYEYMMSWLKDCIPPTEGLGDNDA